jgi:uncharacterized protein (DUF427 family)
MGLAMQQGPLAPGSVGRFLVPGPLPERLLFAEPLRRRMRVRFGGAWIADSEDVLVLHEPGGYPVAYFPGDDIADGTLWPSESTSQHRDLGPTTWYTVRVGDQSAPRAAWQHTRLPSHAGELHGRLAFRWGAMEAFYEEDERILGHAADAYHRIDIRQTSRRLVVHSAGRIIARTTRPLVLYESGFAPRWYVPPAAIDAAALTPIPHQTFCPYKGLASYYDVTGACRAAWSYRDAYPEVARISGLVSFEPGRIAVELDDKQLRSPGQTVIPHSVDRAVAVGEIIAGRQR